MANRSKDRRARSRKRRPAQQDGSVARAGVASVDAAPAASKPPKPPKPPRTRLPRSSPTAPTYGERPPAPWHPLPLSELLILVGAIAAVIGLREGLPNGGHTLLAGLGAAAIGTIEVTLREHRSGYRSHTIMLALLPVVLLHSLIVLGVSAFATLPRLLNVGLLALDLALFAFLFRLLRARFLDARRARVLREG